MDSADKEGQLETDHFDKNVLAVLIVPEGGVVRCPHSLQQQKGNSARTENRGPNTMKVCWQYA